MAWHDHIHTAMQELYEAPSMITDYQWVLKPEWDEPQMVYWNEERFGPLDMAALQERCEEIGTRRPVPEKITKAQAKMVLFEIGKLAEVEEIIKSHPFPPVRIWFDAGEWHRDNVYIRAIGPELGLTDDQVDDLFRAAALKS